MQWVYLVLFFVLGLCHARPEIDLSSAASNLNLDANVNLDDYAVIKERCEKKGKLDSYEKLKTALPETKKCIQNLIDVTKVKDEVEEAKKTGSMDEVFGKYCNRRPQFKECIEKSLNHAKECMEDIEKEGLKFTEKIIDEVGNFACLNDGDRIAMFVAEGGVECLNSRSSGIQKCVNETLKVDTSTLSFSNLTSTSLPMGLSFGITKEKCDDIAKLQNCVVKDLEDNCKDSTPANLVEAVFKFVKKTACKKQKRNAILPRKVFKRQVQTDVMTIRRQMTGPVNYLRKICEQNGHSNASTEFSASVGVFTTCFNPHMMLLRAEKATFFEKYDECLNNSSLIEKLKNCLPDEGKYVPKFAVDLVKSYVEFMYDHQDLLKVDQGNMDIARCFQTVRQPANYQKIGACASEIRQIGNEIPTKEKLCELLSRVDECIGNVIKSICVKDIKIHQIVDDLKTAFYKPCTENPIPVN